MDPTVLRDRIIKKAREFGADDAGVCLAADLLTVPTHKKFALPEGVEKHHCIVVFGLHHPQNQPELDYFIKKNGFTYGNSEGNRRLMDISRLLGQWFEEENISSCDLHYYVERGGIFLKGAAVLAGLGTIGVNNLLVHPGYGTRIRFRAHLIRSGVAPSAPLDFDPCGNCHRPCLNVCPAAALDQEGYSTERCQDRFDRDYDEGINLPADGNRPAIREVHYCRICEFACIYRGDMEKAI